MFFIPWILLLNVRCRSILCVFFVLSLWSAICTSETTPPMSDEFHLKNAKVIEAVPNVLRRVHSSTSIVPDNWDCSTSKACDDPAGYEAIMGLHRQLDDDANGSIDVSETDEFLRDELQYENGYERHKEFHGNDKYINVDELWLVWKMSEVHNWTVDETVEWLITQVDLPQYEHNFRNNGVNGAFLPLLAQNFNNFISHILGIKDSIHKQKIALKAMDVVLFGVPKYRNYFKDVILAFSLVIAISGCWFAYVQHKKSQKHIHKMMKDMETLQRAEDSLMDLQKELSKAKHAQEIVSIEKQDLERRLHDEMTTSKIHLATSGEGVEFDEEGRISELENQLQVARNDLRESEKKLEARHWVGPPSLQKWLQLTHELELRNYNAKKAIAEQQLQAAKEGCEKLSRKRGTFMGAFRIAHGGSIDDVDDRIVKAKSALYEVTSDLQERMHRWKKIENLCGFPIIMNPGITCLESILHPNNVNGTTTGSTHSGLSTLTQSSSATTLREESPPPYAGVVPSVGSNIPSPPPPSYSKSSPSFIKKTSEIPNYAAVPSVSRVAYPRECHRPADNLSSFETDNEDFQVAEIDDDSTERSITPPSLASCPETSHATFTIPDGTSPEIKSKDPDFNSQLSIEHPNGKMGDIVRKISAGIMDKKKKPTSSIVEAIKKSASSSNIVDNNEGASSESSLGTAAEEKKKKKFFQQLRHRKPKS